MSTKRILLLDLFSNMHKLTEIDRNIIIRGLNFEIKDNRILPTCNRPADKIITMGDVLNIEYFREIHYSIFINTDDYERLNLDEDKNLASRLIIPDRDIIYNTDIDTITKLQSNPFVKNYNYYIYKL